MAYSIGQTMCGRLMDRVGARRGLTLTVAWYSVVSMLTSLASGFYSFAAFRFLLGAGESGNWPAATKVVSEWFPKRERALATALFDSGGSLGGAIAPFIVLGIYFRWGWRPAFMIPGLLGLTWLLAWRWLYQPPEKHLRVSAAELDLIVVERGDISLDPTDRSSARWIDLLKLPQTWGIIIAKTFSDPVWFFVTDWFPIYLVAKGIDLKNGLIAVWIPFIAADVGNFFSGWMSGRLIGAGWSVGSARKALVVFGGVGVTLLIPTILTVNLYLITLLFALSTFAYACFTTMANVLPSDVYGNDSVASVSGLSGTGAGIGTILAFWLVGHFSDARQALASHAFDPIVLVAGLVPLLGMILVLLLVRNTAATKKRLVRQI